MSHKRSARPIAAVVALIALVIGQRRMKARGYNLGTNTIVRCRDGHLFTTVWIPGASFKAIKLGFYRFQRCPVGRHWTLVAPVRDQDLTDAERAQAAQFRDTKLP